MARVPESEIEKLKREISVERLATARGVELKRHGADLIGRCPFHEDRTPSLVVSAAKNLWHCLGACQAGGSVIDWVMKAEGVSFRHAVELLRADLPVGVEEDVIKADLGKVLLKLESLQDAQIREAMKPKDTAVVLTDEETVAAMELLRDPRLLDRILEDFRLCGVVGEEVNKLVGYLAAVSRKLDDPLAVVIQSSSAAGKSSLMEAVLAFVPEEERVKYAAMTGQSLFYMGETNLRHKVLAVVEEEGAARASYALKILQSEGELTIASTGKDPETGKLVTHEYRVEGPVMIFLTTTAIEIDEELLNRCLVLTVDEERGSVNSARAGWRGTTRCARWSGRRATCAASSNGARSGRCATRRR